MISEFLTRGATSKISASEQTELEQQFLRFHLLPDTTAMLPVNQMTEVLTVPISLVIPIPQMPSWVSGVYNWQGEILWLVDLGHLLGLTPLDQATSGSTSQVIVIHNAQQQFSKQQLGSKIGRKTLGLVVHRVEDMERCNLDVIQSPLQSAMKAEVLPFLRGYWLKPNGEIIMVLDSSSIIAGMPQPEGFVSF